VSPAAPAPARIAVLADDLLWATRLEGLVRLAGAEPLPVRRPAALEAALVAADGIVVDLTARAYDGLAALRGAADAGVPAIAVAQHDDAPLRRAARGAGAGRVYAYRTLFERGEAELAAWIGGLRGPADAR
jgi:hypothetical protein